MPTYTVHFASKHNIPTNGNIGYTVDADNLLDAVARACAIRAPFGTPSVLVSSDTVHSIDERVTRTVTERINRYYRSNR